MGDSDMTKGGPPAGGRRSKGAACLGTVLVLVVAAVACRPLPLGSASSTLGNDVAGCAQFQPTAIAPCGPQPLLWSSIAGPYESFDSGDPYATKCGPDLPASPVDCAAGPYAGGATNALYDPTGYEFAVDVTAADIGQPISLQVWDAGSYGRTVGQPTTKVVFASMTAGSTTINRQTGANFVAGDVGRPIAGTGIPAGTVIATFVSSSRVTISNAATSTGSQRALTVTTTPECNPTMAPFNAAPYTTTSWNGANCQTGDTGTSPFQLQLFENDGDDEAITFASPIAPCRLYLAPGAGAATHKNAWATVCTFTPTMIGVYPFRVTSSAIMAGGTPIPDTGDGFNNFALRVQGSTTSTLYAVGAMALYANTPAGLPRTYLTELTSEAAGKRLQIDFFDPGDGLAGDYKVQVLGPPSGAPSRVPTGGAVVPAAGLADSCRFNPVASPTRGPDVAAPAGTPADFCTVQTRIGGINVYDGAWLSIEVDIAATYTCTTDCWWSLRLITGGPSEAPADHLVVSPILIDKPAPS